MYRTLAYAGCKSKEYIAVHHYISSTVLTVPCWHQTPSCSPNRVPLLLLMRVLPVVQAHALPQHLGRTPPLVDQTRPSLLRLYRSMSPRKRDIMSERSPSMVSYIAEAISGAGTLPLSLDQLEPYE